MSQKRTRSINWDEEEKQLLRNLLKEDIGIIANKSTEANINKMKIKAWAAVHSRFNSLHNRERTLKQIQNQWKIMKVDCKKNMSAHRVELQRTGGGPKPKSPTLQDLEVACMVPGELTRTCNKFHSDENIVIQVIDTSPAMGSKDQGNEGQVDISCQVSLEQYMHQQAHVNGPVPSTSKKISTPHSPSVSKLQLLRDVPSTSQELLTPQSPSVSKLQLLRDVPSTSQELLTPQSPSVIKLQLLRDVPSTSQELLTPQSPSVSKLQLLRDVPSTSQELLTPQSPSVSKLQLLRDVPSTLQEPSTSQARRVSCLTVTAQAKGKGKKKTEWSYQRAMFNLAHKFRVLDNKRKMKQHEIIIAKHAMDKIEHELKVALLKKKIQKFENKH